MRLLGSATARGACQPWEALTALCRSPYAVSSAARFVGYRCDRRCRRGPMRPAGWNPAEKQNGPRGAVRFEGVGGGGTLWHPQTPGADRVAAAPRRLNAKTPAPGRGRCVDSSGQSVSRKISEPGTTARSRGSHSRSLSSSGVVRLFRIPHFHTLSTSTAYGSFHRTAKRLSPLPADVPSTWPLELASSARAHADERPFSAARRIGAPYLP